MKYRLAGMVLLIGALITLNLLPAGAAPQPHDAQVEWEISFNYKKPQPIMVKIPGKDKPQLYWYLTFRVANLTGKDRMFVPQFVLYTKTGQMIKAGESVNPIVFSTIKKIHNAPLMQNMVNITGKLLQGEDNAKHGVAIFKDFDPKAATFDIFVSGLSGETATIKLPKPIIITETDPNGKKTTTKKETIQLSKTLDLKYTFGVEPTNRANSKLKLLSKSWVMR